MNAYFQTSGNKKAPVNLYYANLQSILSTNNNSRNISGRNNKDISNASNNLIKSKKWNLSEMLEIRKKLNLAIKKRKIIMNNKNIKKKMPTLNHISINSINEGILNNKLSFNNTVRNKKILLSYKNSIIKNVNNSIRHYSNKEHLVKKKINFNNLINNSFKSYKSILHKKKKIKNKKNIPFNINKISINIINNNNFNIKTLKTDGNIINSNNNTNIQNENFNRNRQRKRNFTMEKLPQFDKLIKKNNIKEKNSNQLVYKIVKNKINIFSKKRNNTNLSLSNRLNSIISIHDEISLLTKNLINDKKTSINKRKNIIYEKSIEHKKIIPINYFQDYKNKNNSTNKNFKKKFLNFGDYIKYKNKRKAKNNLLFKLKRPYSKEEKSNLIKIRKKSKERVIKNKILKNVSKKCSLPEPILIKKMIKKENINNKINILSKSEIKKRRAKSNNKSKADETENINLKNYNRIFDKMNEAVCTIDDVLQNKKIPDEMDEFDDLYSIVKLINFDNINIKDNIFCVEDNKNYIYYEKKFDKIWKFYEKKSI